MTRDVRRRVLLATHNAALVLADLTAALLEAEAEADPAPTAPAEGLEEVPREDLEEVPGARRRFMDRVRPNADAASAPQGEVPHGRTDEG